MQILYIYDIKAGSERSFNRIKRRFYYNLGKLGIKKEAWKTKSAISVPLEHEWKMDQFFRSFSRHTVVYKVYAHSIELL